MKIFSTIYLQPEHVSQVLRTVPGAEFVIDPSCLVEPVGRDLLLYNLEGTAVESLSSRQVDRIDPFAPVDLRLFEEVDVLFGRLDPRIPHPIGKFAPRLRWIQTINAGVGPAYVDLQLGDSEVVVTTSSGAFSELLAEFSLAAALAARKNLVSLSNSRHERVWDPQPSRTLADAQVCVIGTGSIGRAVARAFGPLCAGVVGVNRSGRSENDGLFGTVYDGEHLLDGLRDADIVVITLPATPATRNLFDADVFDAIKPGAYLVNVGRGHVIEEEALIRSLVSGRLAGAALDVVAEEPLPGRSPLWKAPNLLLSYHSTAIVPGMAINRIVDIFCENLRRFNAGETLDNVFDPLLGY